LSSHRSTPEPHRVKKFLAALFLVVGCSQNKLRTDIATLTAEAARVDTVRIVDSIAVVRDGVTVNAVRDTLLLNLTDTVLVKRFITRVDTLKLSCDRCTASAARVSAVNAKLRQTNAKLVTRLDRTVWFQKKLLGGYALLASLAIVYAVARRLRLF
jgi:hypothetical protein